MALGLSPVYHWETSDDAVVTFDAVHRRLGEFFFCPHDFECPVAINISHLLSTYCLNGEEFHSVSCVRLGVPKASLQDIMDRVLFFLVVCGYFSKQ